MGEWARVWRRLSAAWGRYTLDRRVSWVPATNTRVAQALGRVWGIRTWAGVEAARLLSPLRVG